MSEVDRRLNHAIANDLDSRVVSPERDWFAWYPVLSWSYEQERHRWVWLRKVSWFNCLGLTNEYFDIRADEVSP